MEVRVFTEIDHPDLISGWNELVATQALFPQSSYAWAVSWWNHQRENQTLYIITVVNSAQQIIAIAPLCIERSWSIRIIRSMPVRFGDFYSFVCSQEEALEEIFETINNHLHTFSGWDIVRLDRVRENTKMFSFYSKSRGWISRLSGNYIEKKLSGYNWESYLAEVNPRVRRNLLARLKKLKSEGEVEFLCLSTPEEYKEVEAVLDGMYSRRLKEKQRKEKSESEISFRKELINHGLKSGEMLLFLLKINGEIIAYRIGFVNNHIYYDWNISFDSDHKHFHPGICSLAYLIQFLLEQNCKGINLMSGNYTWKHNFAPRGTLRNRMTMYAHAKNFRAKLYMKRQLKAPFSS